MKSQTFTVSTTAVQLITKAPANRTIYIHVVGNGVVYLGGADVTTAIGMATEKSAVPFEMFLPANEVLWAVANSSQEVRVMRPANDGN